MSLNEIQEKAAAHLEGPMLVLAGAGSGKTRIVTYRIAHLLKIGVPASEILAVTFTNKAALEMRERACSLTGSQVLTITFHSLGVRILRESIEFLGYKKDFHIYDADDSLELTKQILKILEIKNEKGLAKELKNAISSAKNDLIPPSKAGESLLKFQTNDFFIDAYLLYQQKLKEYNAVDFDDLLFLPVKLFKKHEEVLKRYQKKWQFLLIDEYQDTNQAQYTLAKLLTDAHKNIFVVGDPDQSIYSWRGANIENILNFERDFEGAKVITLDQNYRSTNNILKAANDLIAHNPRQYEKNLWSANDEGALIGHFIANSDREEADFVLDKLEEHFQKDGISFSDSVIFYRTNFQSRLFEDALLRRNIPYTIVGGISFYQRREIKDLLAFLRMIVSDSDFISFARTLNLPKRGIGPATLNKLRFASETQGIPILAFCRELIKGSSALKISKKQSDALKGYVDMIESLRELAKEGAYLNTLISETISRSNYLQVLKSDPETFDDREGNLKELISKSVEWETENHALNLLPSFLEELSLRTTSDEIYDHTQVVKLMTLHNSKGLEFSLAFMVGMEEDLFPHVNAKETPEGIEEERRLCYVGMTRAKKFLYLTASDYRFLWGSSRYMLPSRFLSEIPRKYLNLYHEEDEREETEESHFHPMDSVVHKDFGKGVVKKCYQTSLGLTYDVFFSESDLLRTLVAKYAKLTPGR
ncbi:MAG: UvrD-helicase domain-containing protein [Simkaniaceae bacterium]